jgi:hypothetical protein
MKRRTFVRCVGVFLVIVPGIEFIGEGLNVFNGGLHWPTLQAKYLLKTHSITS